MEVEAQEATIQCLSVWKNKPEQAINTPICRQLLQSKNIILYLELIYEDRSFVHVIQNIIFSRIVLCKQTPRSDKDKCGAVI